MRILLVNLPLGKARVVDTSRRESPAKTVAALFHDAFARGEARLRVFNLAGRHEIPESSSLEGAGIRDGDILIAAYENPFPPDAPVPADTIPAVGSFEAAREQVSRFDHYGHVPQSLRCQVNDSQFQELVHAATERLGERDSRFGGPKLVVDMMVTADLAYRRANHHYDYPGHLARQLFRVLVSSDYADREEFNHFEARIRDALSPHPPYTETRYLFNAAAMRLERPPFSATSLIDLVRDGAVLVGEIRVETIDDVRLPELVLNDDTRAIHDMDHDDCDQTRRDDDDANDCSDDSREEQV